MKLVRAAAVGLAFALGGIIVWAAIAYFAHRDLGVLAWVVGALAGLGVYLAARGPRPEADDRPAFRGRRPVKDRADSAPMPPGLKHGLLAAGVALLAVFAGKFAAVSLAAADPKKAAFQYSDEEMVRQIAHDTCKERQAKGQKLAFPPGMVLERAHHPIEFPPGVWDEAEAKWKAMPPAEQKQKVADRVKAAEALAGQMQATVKQPGVWDSIGTLDVLWLLLAVGTAFGLAWRAKPAKEEAEE